MFNGNIHYFILAIFHSYVNLPENNMFQNPVISVISIQLKKEMARTLAENPPRWLAGEHVLCFHRGKFSTWAIYTHLFKYA